jgi:competence protein CoiA
MKFAIVNNIKTEAEKGVKGYCPICSAELTARCGIQKVHHWAHKIIRNCDPWWENETEWHRTWKGKFSTTWQEVICMDSLTGEKHIADIKTEHGLVIEFQHSHIDPIERNSRERFYKNMLWVINGTRLKRDYPRFLKGKATFRSTKQIGIFLVDNIEDCFPSSWISCSVPVVFDFKGSEEIQHANDLRNYLYYLFPKTNTSESMVAIISRESFINWIINDNLFKQQKETLQQTANPQLKKTNNLPQRQSPYVYVRGRYVKRKRF